MKLSMVISILFHLSVFITISTLSDSGEDGSHKGGSLEPVRMKLIDKPQDSESIKKQEEIPENKSEVHIKKEKLPPEQVLVEHDCEDFYTGIGIYSAIDCLITDVPKGYPAHRADIRVGDLVILENGECPGRGPIGTKITIRILRGSQSITKTLIREKICTSPEEK